MKAVIRHLPPENPLGLRLQRHQREENDGHSKNTQWTIPRGTLASIRCCLTKNIKFQEIFKQNNTELQLSGPTASNHLDVCAAMVTPAYGRLLQL
jgi:hypothetical protein